MSVAAWLAVSSPGRTFLRPNVFSACRAAQSRCSTARASSNRASSSGFPVSSEIVVASWSRRRTSAFFHSINRRARPSNPSSAHHRAASAPRATAASTAAVSCTGWVPTSSPVRGSREVKVAAGTSVVVTYPA